MEGGCTHVMPGRSLMAIDPRIPTGGDGARRVVTPGVEKTLRGLHAFPLLNLVAPSRVNLGQASTELLNRT